MNGIRQLRERNSQSLTVRLNGVALCIPAISGPFPEIQKPYWRALPDESNALCLSSIAPKEFPVALQMFIEDRYVMCVCGATEFSLRAIKLKQKVLDSSGSAIQYRF